MGNMQDKAVRRLFGVIAQLQSEEECADFFEDVCTIKEIQDMAKRLDAAMLLDRGLSYQTVSAQAGISTATISRVSKCLNYGTGGYKKALQRINSSEESK